MANDIHLKRYEDFINSRSIRNKVKESGYEIHHILPRSLGGQSDDENLIKLTCREHFIAHLILWKAYGHSMAYAFWLMSRIKKTKRHLTSRQFESMKIEAREFQTHFKTTAGTLWITNGTIHQRITSNESIPEGWRLGRITTPGKGSKWITNGVKLKRIPRENTPPVGWWIESKQKKREKFWVTNGVASKTIYALRETPEGWARGRLVVAVPGNKGIKYRRITNGISNKMIPEVSSPPDGWYYGMAGFPAKVG